MKIPVVLALMLILSGCATTSHGPVEPIVIQHEVDVPVTIACVPKTLAPAPEYPDTDQALKAAADAAVRYQLVTAGRALRMARLGELEPIVVGCAKE